MERSAPAFAAKIEQKHVSGKWRISVHLLCLIVMLLWAVKRKFMNINAPEMEGFE